MDYWRFVYENNEIEVKNTPSTIQLYINGELAAEHKGLDLGANLIGKLNNGEEVLVTIHGGLIRTRCEAFVIKQQLSQAISE